LNNHIKNRTTDYYESEHRLKHKDGTYRWILDTGRIVETRPDDPSIPVRATGIHQDITRRKKLELKLEREKRRLARANHVKATFIANMSHEIRTPINGILGANQLLQQDKHFHDHPLLKIVQYSTEHLLSIVNEILDFSKMEGVNVLIKNAQVYLPDLMEKIKSIYYPRILEKNLEFEIKVSPESESGIYFLADEKRILQIIFNLLNNSVKFTKDGKIALNVKIDSKNLQFVVKDTGRGMSKEFLKKIYMPFLQENDTKSREQGGTGLGTTIVKKLVDQMKGKIGVKSKLGKGTTFTISLPLELIPKEEGEKVANQKRGKSSKINVDDCDYQGKKILLVEDNELNTKIAKIILERINLKVVHARNGQEVLDIVHKHHWSKNSHRPFELILMDSQLPIYDGETLTKMLRKEGYKMPIIALTANVYSDDIERYLRSGMNDFLGKPYKIKELVYILDKYL
jgi:signal transduction histidine kinase/ActR/RegA family two-component response regulator